MSLEVACASKSSEFLNAARDGGGGEGCRGGDGGELRLLPLRAFLGFSDPQSPSSSSIFLGDAAGVPSLLGWCSHCIAEPTRHGYEPPGVRRWCNLCVQNPELAASESIHLAHSSHTQWRMAALQPLLVPAGDANTQRRPCALSQPPAGGGCGAGDSGGTCG